MENKNIVASGSAVGLPTILTSIFVTLKLTNVISWSWWLVVMPTIVQVSLVGLLLLPVFIFFFYAMYKSREDF